MNNFFLWLGASISLAEIEVGGLFNNLSTFNAIFSILLGHLFGGFLFFAMSYISANLKQNAMSCVGNFYSNRGKIFFASLNAVTLICWSAVMIMSAAQLLNKLFINVDYVVFSLCLSILLSIWMFLKYEKLMLINNLVIVILFFICIYIFIDLFKLNENITNINLKNTISAIELSVAMPISWLALVGDYTKNFNKPLKQSLIISCSYFIGSSFMYILGYFASFYFDSFGDYLVSLKLSFVIVFLVVFSTITTTYLDVFSANESLKSINFDFQFSKALIILLALIIAIFVPFSLYEKFLYVLSSVFLPMACVMVNVYVFKLQNQALYNFIIWFIGFVTYQILIYYDFLASVLTILIILILSLGVNYVSRNFTKN